MEVIVYGRNKSHLAEFKASCNCKNFKGCTTDEELMESAVNVSLIISTIPSNGEFKYYDDLFVK
jgi:hypothetical protein